jgi:hypothetical protein
VNDVGVSIVEDAREISGSTEETSDPGAIKCENGYAELLEIPYPRVTRFLGDCDNSGCNFRAI